MQAVYAGVEVQVGEDGYMTDHAQWTREIGAAIAVQEGIVALTEAHWKVISYLQEQVKATGTMPTIRGLKSANIIPVKELYELFPGGPLKKASKIAGLKKPESCV